MGYGKKLCEKTLYDDKFFANSLFTREQFYEWGYLPRPAPKVQIFSPPFPNPKNDNEALLNSQARWFFDGNEDAWNRIWQGCMNLAAKMITQTEIRHGILFSKERREDAQVDACEYILRRISDTTTNYRVQNFLAAMYFGVLHALFFRTKAEVFRDLMAYYCEHGKTKFNQKIKDMAESAKSLSQNKRKKRLAEIAAMHEKVLFLVERQGEPNDED